MKRTFNGLLLAGTLAPLILLFWPFLTWGPAMGCLLRVIPALSLQTLLCRAGKHPAVEGIPLVLTGALALWGTYLYLTSPHWSGATVWDLLLDYLSPFISCAIVFCLRRKK